MSADIDFEKSVLVILRQKGRFMSYLWFRRGNADNEMWERAVAEYNAKRKDRNQEERGEICDDPLVREICAAWEKKKESLRKDLGQLCDLVEENMG